MSITTRRVKSGALRYDVRIKHAGQLVATRTFRRQGDAETWEREQYRALQLGEFLPPSQTATPFAKVVAAFLEARRDQVAPHTWRTDSDNLKATPRAWAALPVASIGKGDILRHLTDELKTKARSTVSRSRTTLSALFNYAVQEEMLLRNPVREVSMPPGKEQNSEDVETFTDAELADTLRRQYALNPLMAEVTEFISLTGVRWSELRSLRVRNLQNLTHPAVRVLRAQSDGYEEKGTKTRKGRTVPLVARAYAIAGRRAEGRDPDEYLFASKTGRQLSGNLFRRYLKWGETAHGFTIHALRHYAASSWLRAGIPVNQVSEWLGHKNPNTTLRIYAHVLGEAQDIAAIARLNAIAPPPPPPSDPRLNYQYPPDAGDGLSGP
ncbi:tyrosine-type recombinase/integrase [Leifsonia sp. TF02-11]|uniref:tyrosine-type recombinase/integrase n=1 Tax=Leifsonia sp. TF02-11 TaxID=2815212 RepID=UPI001AA0E0F9|nr:tyrosine-type recombinase/integrase [Leifsonia sp. TF02-11]MBO1740723.1 tyrosine-type recombinase/integrase [Leifsonia sp. TF02-11]